ncbi:MAG: C40 family peptidase [Oscillospiraceae bacterium]|nr:C40 family peptidase [Oscillospiraceae bacterium]
MKKKLGILALILAVLMNAAACKSIDDGDPDAPDGSRSSDSPDVSDSLDVSESSDSSDASETPPPASDTASEETTTTTPLQQTEETTTTPPYIPVESDNPIVQTAEALIGIPFADNGTTPADGFDNSGFIYYVLRENGFINCPRNTGEQAAMGTHIAYDELKSGDLAFFATDDSGNPDFGGIYIGEGKMIYCPMPGQTVKVADITSDYWKNAFIVGVSLS